MRILELKKRVEGWKYVTISINDQELFRSKCIERVNEGETIDLYDLDEEFFSDCVEVEEDYADVQEEFVDKLVGEFSIL
jgi:hypothetical protein